MRWSEAGYLSQFVLSHALRQASVSLIFDVRQKKQTIMPHPQINANGTWIRCIHDTWANTSGYRTDIRASVLEDPEVKRAAYVLDDRKAILVPIAEVRRALASAPRRANGCVGPYYVNPHSKTLNDVRVEMEIRNLEEKKEGA